MNPTFVKDFWDKKILKWEEDKYYKRQILGRWVDVNHSLKMRMNIARSVIKKIGAGSTLLELGCGSGQLLPTVLESGPRRYVGIDISSVAIQKAKEQTSLLDKRGIAEFKDGDVNAFNAEEFDFCFSLGLLDWLSLGEIEQIMKNVKCKYYLHSYSRKNLSIQQLLHRFYVFLLYGHKSSHYTPRYYQRDKIHRLFHDCYGHSPDHYSAPSLSFGAFVYHLPFPIS